MPKLTKSTKATKTGNPLFQIITGEMKQDMAPQKSSEMKQKMPKMPKEAKEMYKKMSSQTY